MEKRTTDNIPNISNIKSMSINELTQLAQDLRYKITNTVAKNGGHLASNLGVVELTIALHRVFDSANDKIVFDVGHQCYAHKILTGRDGLFDTLRQENGISGFPKREESKHDAFNTGHSSTAISAAVGMARVRDLAEKDHNIVALIGDGAMTGGMVWEALSDAGHYGKRIIIILNDNEMSISENVGAISALLSNMRSARGYMNLKGAVARGLKKVPVIGKPIKHFIERIKNGVRYFFVPNVMFEQLGFRYYGIVDGHDIQDLEKIFQHVKYIQEPVLVHVKTQKGKGVKFAEERPDNYHSTSPFNAETGEKYNVNYKIPNAMGDYLTLLAEKDPKLCAVTAAMEHGCGLGKFKDQFADRFFDVGIAEQHAVTMCSGMAAAGFKPVFFVYSTFLQRAYDQILHDMCMQNLGVTIVAYNSGVVGSDGETHHGVFDVSFLRHIPNLTIYTPANIEEAQLMLEKATGSKKPCVILLPKSMPSRAFVKPKDIDGWLKYTKAATSKVAVFASGGILVNAMDAVRSNDLYKKVDVFNANMIKPIDHETIKQVALKYQKIVTFEDNVIMGGFGSAVLEELSKIGYDTTNFESYGYPDEYINQGNIESLHKIAKIDTQSIIDTLLRLA